LHELADVALHQHEILGRIARRRRIVAAVAQPDLMDEHARLDGTTRRTPPSSTTGTWIGIPRAAAATRAGRFP